MSAEVISLGCRLNIAESESLRALLANEDNVVVVNSCAVTAEAVRQTRQAIRKARRARPEARLLVTGCAAQIEPQTFAAMAEVDAVIGNEEKLKADTYAAFGQGALAHCAVNDIMSVRQTAPQFVDHFDGHETHFSGAPAGLTLRYGHRRHRVQ